MKLHYSIEGSGPPLALLHPVGLDGTAWDPVMPALASGHRVLRIDLRGHGKSPPATPGMTLADFAVDVHETLADAGSAPTALAGLSFGGMVAQTLAILHPADVSRLVVAGCPSTLPPPARQALSERGEKALEGGMAAIVPETLERWFTADFAARSPDRVQAIAAILSRTAPEGWNAGWQAISAINTAPRLPEIKVPTLCIAGEHDPASPPAALAAIAARIPGARLLVLRGAPHIMHVEQPDAFTQALTAFLAGADIGDEPARSAS